MNRTLHPPASAAGFSLVEICVAVLVASLAALLLLKSSQSNLLARTHSLNRASAVRLGTELADWTRRGGHHGLDTSLAEALDTPPPVAYSDCHLAGSTCDSQQAAWHYLLRWRERLHESIVGVRLLVCNDRPPRGTAGDWQCDAAGSAYVLKIGTAGRHDSRRPLAVVYLGSAS